MHSKHTSAEIGWSVSQTLRDGADALHSEEIIQRPRNIGCTTQMSQPHNECKAVQSPGEALEGSQVTVQRPPSVQGLLYILGGHLRLITSRLIPLQDGAEALSSNVFMAGRSRASSW